MMVVGQYFIHQIKLTTKYGKEPKNRPQTLEEIRSGKINFVDGRYSTQRASEIPWAVELATEPDCIVPNWQALGTGDENYVRNFGTAEFPQWRVLVRKVVGQTPALLNPVSVRNQNEAHSGQNMAKKRRAGRLSPLYRYSKPLG
jgi:hypothetical protein